MNALQPLVGADLRLASTPAVANAGDRTARLRRRVAPWLVAAALAALCRSAHAAANFADVTAFLQAFANFMTGPFGKAVVVISIIAAFCTWVFAPRDGIFGPVLRVVVAGIAIMNAAMWVGQFGAGTDLPLG